MSVVLSTSLGVRIDRLSDMRFYGHTDKYVDR